MQGRTARPPLTTSPMVAHPACLAHHENGYLPAHGPCGFFGRSGTCEWHVSSHARCGDVKYEVEAPYQGGQGRDVADFPLAIVGYASWLRICKGLCKKYVMFCVLRRSRAGFAGVDTNKPFMNREETQHTVPDSGQTTSLLPLPGLRYIPYHISFLKWTILVSPCVVDIFSRITIRDFVDVEVYTTRVG